MDANNVDFAREMISAFGEDRFYHAATRPTVRGASNSILGSKARQIFLALGGSHQVWPAKCHELKLSHQLRETDLKEIEINPEESRSILCRTAFMIAKHHKEYAHKKPKMPANIHARMILDSQNEWTQRYIEVLEEFES